MSLEQGITELTAAMKDVAAAIREQIGAQKQTIILDTTPVGATSDNPSPTAEQLAVKVSGGTVQAEVTEQEPITGNNPNTLIVDEIAAEVTYDEMRSAFMKVPSKCGADVAREILAKFSCSKVPQVPAEHYAEVKRLSEEALAKAGK